MVRHIKPGHIFTGQVAPQCGALLPEKEEREAGEYTSVECACCHRRFLDKKRRPISKLGEPRLCAECIGDAGGQSET